MNRTPAVPLLLPLAAALAACAGGGAYPSLAMRPNEGRSWAEAPAPPAPAVPVDPALDDAIDQASAALKASAAAFAAADGRAAPLVAAALGTATGGERWVAAEAALADLDAAHAGTSAAVGTLEDLAATRAQALRPDYPALEKARAGAAAQADTEATRIRALGAMLPAA